jgi:hypothetical protein
MLLGVFCCIIKQIEYLVFFVLEVIDVTLELALDLKLLAKEHRISFVQE